jgi:hypothetical protein
MMSWNIEKFSIVWNKVAFKVFVQVNIVMMLLPHPSGVTARRTHMNKRQSIALLFSLFSVMLTSNASASLSSEDYPDLYASVLFDEAPAKGVDVAAHPGYGDSYGSILLDPAPKSTMDVAAQPGYGDNYGSILLDLPSNTTAQVAVQYTHSTSNSSI